MQEAFRSGSRNGNRSRTVELEEEIYWNNFKSMRFFQFLSGDFLSQLMVPKKFSEKLKGKLPQVVVLEGPGGATRDVQIARSKNATLFFKEGWEEFAKAHDFKENDLLIFKYDRVSHFKVWVFDGKHKCENAGAYFVRKSACKEDTEDGSAQGKRKNRESSFELPDNVEDSEYEGSDCGWTPAKERKSCIDSGNRSRKRDADFQHLVTPHAPSNRTPITEENDRIFQLALREATPDCFLVVLKGAHFSPRYRLCISAPWARTHLAPKNQDIQLHVNEKMWIVRINIQRRTGAAVVTSGWFNFISNNSLQEFDVCLFKLCSKVNNVPAILDVRIFRNGEELVHPTPP